MNQYLKSGKFLNLLMIAALPVAFITASFMPVFDYGCRYITICGDDGCEMVTVCE